MSSNNAERPMSSKRYEECTCGESCSGQDMITHYIGDECPGGHVTLSPIQSIWDAWTPVIEQIYHKPAHYFPSLIQLQLIEIAVGEGKSGDHMSDEIVDIISVCVNWLRWYYCDYPDDIVELINERVHRRYVNQAQAILDKYSELYGL